MNDDEYLCKTCWCRVADAYEEEHENYHLSQSAHVRAAESKLALAEKTIQEIKEILADGNVTYSLTNRTEWDVQAGITPVNDTVMFVERDAIAKIIGSFPFEKDNPKPADPTGAEQ